jgi:hypothetical protein
MMDEASIEIVDARNQKQIDKGNSPFILGLAQQAMRGMIPTPQASDYVGTVRNNDYSLRHIEHQTGWLKKMLPTPTKSDYQTRWRMPNWKGDDLVSEVNHILGTRSQLNPRFVAEMMGFPHNWTELPFQNGERNPSKDMETQ